MDKPATYATLTPAYLEIVQAILDAEPEEPEEKLIEFDPKKANELSEICARVGGMSAVLFAVLYSLNYCATKKAFDSLVKETR